MAQDWQHKQQENVGSAGGSIVLEPSQLHKQGILSSDEIQELFIEMCFFARLGFLQPPCCLRCSYQESMEECDSDLTCERWVVWRRNAETPLHPNQLDNNIAITKCHVARSLLKGNAEGGHTWDKVNKRLVPC